MISFPNNLLGYCTQYPSTELHVTQVDVLTTEYIFSKNVDALHEMQNCIKTNPVSTIVHDVTRKIMNIHMIVTLKGDLMFVNIIPYLITRA